MSVLPPPHPEARQDEPLFQPDPPSFGAVTPAVIKSSRFGGSPWWSSGWWNLPQDGLATDLLCDAGVVGARAVAAVSMRGHKHRLAGEPNQDSFAVRWTSTAEGPVVIAVVCDGMSSAPHSAHGSRRVANLFADELKDGLGEKLLNTDDRGDDVTAALERVIASTSTWAMNDHGVPRAEPRLVRPTEFETTLTFAVVAAEEGVNRCAVGWIGDSPVFLLRDGRFRRAGRSASPAGDVETSATQGVFSSPRPSIHRSEIRAGAALLLCTDGVGNFIDDGERTLALGERLADAWRTPVGILTFANQVAFDLPTADDDRTAVMIWPTAHLC